MIHQPHHLTTSHHLTILLLVTPGSFLPTSLSPCMYTLRFSYCWLGLRLKVLLALWFRYVSLPHASPSMCLVPQHDHEARKKCLRHTEKRIYREQKETDFRMIDPDADNYFNYEFSRIPENRLKCQGAHNEKILQCYI